MEDAPRRWIGVVAVAASWLVGAGELPMALTSERAGCHGARLSAGAGLEDDPDGVRLAVLVVGCCCWS